MRRINAAGLALVKENEGLRLDAYRCPAGILSIGYGSTGPHVRPGMTITKEQAEQLLMADIAWAEDSVSGAIGNAATTDNQFSAMVSLCFNIGAGGFRGSTVLRRHVGGEYKEAADAFLMWSKAHVNGVLVVLPGLLRRRGEERMLYQTPDVPGAVDNVQSSVIDDVDGGVRWLQHELLKTGHYKGVVDGVFGQLSYAAIRAYQAQHHVPVRLVPRRVAGDDPGDES